MNIKAELRAVNASPSVVKAIEKLFGVHDSQGHSGGSHSVLMSWLRAWEEDLVPKEEIDSLLVPYSNILFSIPDDNEREQVLHYFNLLIDHKVLSPLTGEDHEWVDHGPGNSYQNKRMGSVFKDSETGEAYYLDGRVFASLRPDSTRWVGYTNFYSRTEVTFPWLPPEGPERHYFLTGNYDVMLPEHIDPAHHLEAHNLKYAAGYVNGDYIHPQAFFVKPEDTENLLQHFNEITAKLSKFDYPTKLMVIKNLTGMTWDEGGEENDESIRDLRRELEGVAVYRRLLYPLIRIFACIPHTARLENGVYYGLRDSTHIPQFSVPDCPSKHFQEWVPMKGKYANHLVVSVAQLRPVEELGKRITKDETVHFDRVGYEIKFVGDNDNYLWAMRRRFKLKHPKPPERRASTGYDNLPDCAEPQ